MMNLPALPFPSDPIHHGIDSITHALRAQARRHGVDYAALLAGGPAGKMELHPASKAPQTGLEIHLDKLHAGICSRFPASVRPPGITAVEVFPDGIALHLDDIPLCDGVFSHEQIISRLHEILPALAGCLQPGAVSRHGIRINGLTRSLPGVDAHDAALRGLLILGLIPPRLEGSGMAFLECMEDPAVDKAIVAKRLSTARGPS